MPKESPSSEVRGHRPISTAPLLSKVFKKIIAGKLSHILKSNNLLPPLQFSYRRGLRTCDALLTLSHHQQVALDRGMERMLVLTSNYINFSAAFDAGVTAICCIS